MTNTTTDGHLVWVVLAIVAAIVLLPALAMGIWMVTGAGPMMGGMWGHAWSGSGVTPVWIAIGLGMRLLFLAVVVGGAYLGYRALAGETKARDSAIEELRTAYARGDLSDEEFERRRERLQEDT